MEVIWFVFFAVLLAGYFALEGFDLGVGLLLPVLGRTRENRDRMVAAVAPYVLANEVWLVAVAGTMVGVYPLLEGEVLFGLYPLVVAMLLSWVVRDAGLWFRRRLDGYAWRGLWDAAIAFGSLGLSFGWGMTLYAAATGFASPPVHPLGVLLGVVMTLLFALHGWTFLAWRTPGEFGATRSGLALLATGLVAAIPAVGVLVGAMPYLLGHSAPLATLNVLSVMVLPFAPIILGAQIWVWRTFRPGKDAFRFPSFF
ncbi:cytochrome d ubiquinol oxidase subunit II [Nonomuraea sp. KC401]|uniref:cytochrome d ubiquinol oxidase subunit II n=1 Tax=unclassified Nonomuraea TaxID=2593643 RepID=UPI0010FD6F84|nr:MULTISPECIES: cytochrome d ubiquinol oxidase subunit II [unclassified Nonomuraea]NBE94895.1 cytochrome d ubiquinol oxidase subunit II [Nonomuraea sp. K271]TLF72250.1 cytochrome d ubiquinol oxidase subunit II [Nonomuraea sp. KC401]